MPDALPTVSLAYTVFKNHTKEFSHVIKMRSMCRQSVVFFLIKWYYDELALSQNKLR